jgi:hypothetical protein
MTDGSTNGAGAAPSPTGCRAVAVFAAVFVAVFVVPEAAAPSGGSASRNLRTTGGSTVEEADRTNSPSSWSLAMTTLLSTPSSFASS